MAPPGPAPQVVGPGPNDAAMLEPDNPVSNTVNAAVEYMMGLGGFSTQRRGQQGDGDATGAAPGDNSFYRDYASWMPGWGNTFGLDALDPNGVPSGATAQDRATNYVGHSDPTGVWGDVRENLVTNETASIAAARARGETNITFDDVYDGHVDAYADAQSTARAADPTSTASNPFIDPASFGLAMYGAPLLEHAGINTGPITGASIDLFNDPTDSVEDGWAKRMALSGGATIFGSMMSVVPGASMLANPITEYGISSGVHNTRSAIDNGMTATDALTGFAHLGEDVVDAGVDMATDAATGLARWALPGVF